MSDIWNILKNTSKPIVLYGAGGQARRLLHQLQKEGIEVFCFCVTQEQDENEKIEQIAVYSYTRLKEICGEYRLLIAVTAEKLHEITGYLQKNKEQNRYTHMCMPFKVEEGFLTKEEHDLIRAEKIRDCFEDETSKNIFDKMVLSKQTGDMSFLIDEVSGQSFFDEPLLDKTISYTYIDCGAYTGDTIMQFCQFNGFRYKKIIGIEMEEGNFADLEKFVQFANLRDVWLIHTGLWSEERKKTMYTSEKRHFENSNLYTEYDNVSSTREKSILGEDNTKCVVETKVSTLDGLFAKDGLHNGLIKINAMGADFEILKGGRKLIEQHKPLITLEYGVCAQHIRTIPQFLKSFNFDYRLYLRQKKVNESIKTILYAISKG